MTALSNRQRVTVNAALASIHAAGYDANIPSRAARADIAAGTPAVTAHTRALNSYVASLPDETQAVIEKLVNLVHHSDDATIAQYDHAINSYNATGDEAAIEALYPMMAQDGVALALKNGEITQAEIDDGTGVAAALGYEPMPEQIAALQSPAPEAPPAAPPAPQQFRPAQSPAAPQPVPNQQNGIVRDDTGGVSYSSARIAPQASRAPLTGIGRDSNGGVSYSSARSGSGPRPGSFQPIVRQPVAPGEGPTLEKAGASW
jgi:hypothetical protein